MTNNHHMTTPKERMSDERLTDVRAMYGDFHAIEECLAEIDALRAERDEARAALAKAREMANLMLKAVHERGALKIEVGDGPYTVLLNIRDALEPDAGRGIDTTQQLGSLNSPAPIPAQETDR